MQGQQDEQGEGAQANGHAEAAGEGIREFMRPPPNRPTVSSEHLLLHSAQNTPFRGQQGVSSRRPSLIMMPVHGNFSL